MRQEIRENLSATLSKPLEKERVVYIMVEARKFIDKIKEEHGSSPAEWNTVEHWCDWVVHTTLNRKFANETLKTMEEFIINNPDDKFSWSQFNHQFVSLEALRWDFYNFLETTGLPTEITNIPPWNMFTKYLVEHLRDCPLKKSSGLIREFRFIKKPHIPEAEKYSISYQVCFDNPEKNLTGSVLRFEPRKKVVKNPS